jgi:hypothetical protein
MYQFVVYALIFSAGWICNHVWFKYNISEHPEKMKEMIEGLKQIKEINDRLKANDADINVRIEQHGTMTYLFNQDSGQFISQGIDLDEALEKAEKRFPNTHFHH